MASPYLGIDLNGPVLGKDVVLSGEHFRKLVVEADIVTMPSVSLPGDTADLDTGAGTDDHVVVAFGLPGAGGHVVGGTATAPIRTDPTGTTTQPVSGTVTVTQSTASSLNAQVVGNVAHDAADTGNPVKAGARFNTTLPTVTDGKRVDLQADNRGELIVTLGTALDSSVDSITAVGNVAHDAADTGNPVKIGGIASSSVPTAVSSGDRVNAYHDLSGRQVVLIDTALPAGTNALGTVTAVGDFAHDAVDGGNPIKMGGKAASSAPAAVSAGDRVNGYFDLNGRLVVFLDSALPAGTNALGTVTAVGDFAHDAVDGGNPVKVGGKASSSLPAAVSNGDRVNAYFDLNGQLVVNLGTRLDPANDAVAVGADAVVTGQDTFRSTTLTNTPVAVKASSGRFYTVHVENPNGTKAYVQLYDAATGSVTVGTTTPKLSFFVPGNGAYDLALPVPISFATAITIAATTTVGGGTAPGSNLNVNIGYK